MRQTHCKRDEIQSPPALRGVDMNKTLQFAVAVLLLTTACGAQSFLIIQPTAQQRVPPRDATKIYQSAMAAVQREFGGVRPVDTQITVVVGADANEAVWDKREIRLTKWDPYLFAQGIVIFAFEDLMPTDRRLAIAKRALTWTDSTVDVHAITK
jgi:hypothetical protein